MILPLFRVMTSMYTVSMNAVMTVSIAYDHFAGDSDLDNYSKMGPTVAVVRLMWILAVSSMQAYLGLCAQCKLPVWGSKS